MTKVETALSSFIDRSIAVVFPGRALKRQMHRDILALNKRAELYEAAKADSQPFPWLPGNSNVNDIIAASTPALRARIRKLIRDFPYLDRAANVMVDYSVGPGIVFQSMVKDNDGKLDKKTRQKIEDAVRWWMDEADISGKLHYYELMRLTKRQDLESGEFLLVKAYPKDRNRYLPFSLQSYESDWLSSTHDNYGASVNGIGADTGLLETRQGIEYEKATGRITGYWFRDPNYGGTEVYVSAEQVLHGFKTLRPQQLRGVSPFASGVIIADELNDYINIEIETAKMAEKWLAFVYTENPGLRQESLVKNQQEADGTIKKIESVKNAIIEYLRPNEKIEFAASNRPGTTFQPFVRLILTMLSISTGVPYELISGDYQGLNYSTARIVRNDFSQQLRPIAARHIRQFGMPTIRTAIDMAVLTGRLDLPGYWRNPQHYLEGEWQPPGMDAVDPLREAKSQVEAISFGLKSPQEVARERGRDLEDIYKEILAAREMADDMGLTFEQAKTAAKSNPAAIMNED